MSNKVILLTGSNRGIGKAIAEQIVAGSEPVTLLATSRAGVDFGLKAANPATIIEYPKLELAPANEAQIANLVKHVKSTYGKLDVLINNAGVLYDVADNSTFGPDLIKDTFALNFYAVAKMLDAFIPIIPKGGRVVNVSSTAALSPAFDNVLLRRRLFEEKPGFHELDQLIHEYQLASKTDEVSDGWQRDGFAPVYTTSKTFVNLLTEAYAREHPDLLINAVCPGAVATDMAPTYLPLVFKTPAQGARVPLRAALGDIDGVTGKFIAGKTSSDTGPGEVWENWWTKKAAMDFVQ